MNHIQSALQYNRPFFIGRIAGIELQTAYDVMKGTLQQIVQDQKELENNAGIHIKHRGSLPEYVRQLLEAYDHCTLIAEWNRNGPVYEITGRGQELVAERTPHIPKIDALELEPYYHSSSSQTWMNLLKGKRILVIHPFKASIEKQLPNLSGLFPDRAWFEDCTFQVMMPPMTMAGNHGGRDWQDEISAFYRHLDKVNDFDVALVAAGGYGMLISDYIYTKMNRSVMYIGGALQIFFGIIGKRWFTNSDIMKLVTDDWIRPSSAERPPNHTNVERGCYW